MGCVSVRPVAVSDRALADLTEISTQIETAVVCDREGTVVAATVADDLAGRLAATALELLRAAEEHGHGHELVQLNAVLADGSVFVVRDADRVIAAATAPEPTVGLVFYDLKSCLRALGEEQTPPPKPKRRAPAKRGTAKKTDADA
jgi:predicted regulator of Ras-like GTPase activity (Roadblock/LC7/MglB family)